MRASLLSLLLLAGCQQKDAWWDQLEADSPCYRVDLLGGFDETSPAEVRALFDCLNRQDHLAALVPAADALEAPSPRGDAVGVETARALNALPKAGVDVLGLAGAGARALRADDRPVDDVLDLGLEAIYGVPANRVRSGQVATFSSQALDEGLLVPLAPVLPVAAEAAIEDDLRAVEVMSEAAASPEARRWLRTLDAYARSDHPQIRQTMDPLIGDLGQALLITHAPDNDHYGVGTGDSLRDVSDALLQGPQPLIDPMQGDLLLLLSDPQVRAALPGKLQGWHADGHLAELGDQVAWLASVNVDGQPLDRGELSALHAFVRLLHDTNQPMSCSLDLWVTELEVDLGNLAVSILGVLAGQDPELLQGGAGIMGSVLGWDFSQWVLTEIADTGVCPTFTPQVVEDLRAIDVIAEPEATDMLVVFTDLLEVLQQGQQDQIPTLADLVTTLHAGEGTKHVEELIRDVGPTVLARNAVELVPALVEPQAYGLQAGPQPAADLDDLLDLLLWLVEPVQGETGWAQLEPVARPVLAKEEPWEVLGRLGGLMADPESRTGELVELLPRLVDLDPDLLFLEQVAPILGDRAVAEPLLRVIESEEVVDAWLATTPQQGQPEVPLAFAGGLVVDGTLDDLLAMIDITLRRLDDLAAHQPEGP